MLTHVSCREAHIARRMRYASAFRTLQRFSERSVHSLEALGEMVVK
jgi:hypothetical protein